MTKFVILGMRRTGSNLLAGMLDSHPHITCHHELFHPGGIYCSLSFREKMNGAFDIKQRDRDPRGFLDFIWDYDYGDRGRAVGFKLFSGQNERLLKEVLRDTSIAKIILERRNLLHMYTSFLIARETGVYSALKGAAPSAGAAPEVAVKPGKFFKYVKEVHRFYQHLWEAAAAGGREAIRLEYETLLSEESRRKTAVFLGADPEPGLMKVRHVKQNPPLLKERISNYPAVCEALNGTPYEVFLDPGIPDILVASDIPDAAGEVVT